MQQDSNLHVYSLYRKYLCIGGMPEMVEDFVSKNMNILDINRNIIEDINSAYIKDMNKFIII